MGTWFLLPDQPQNLPLCQGESPLGTDLWEEQGAELMSDSSPVRERKELAVSLQSLVQDGGAGCSGSLWGSGGVWCVQGTRLGWGKCEPCIVKVKFFGSQISHFRAGCACTSKPALAQLWEDPCRCPCVESLYIMFILKKSCCGV